MKKITYLYPALLAALCLAASVGTLQAQRVFEGKPVTPGVEEANTLQRTFKAYEVFQLDGKALHDEVQLHPEYSAFTLKLGDTHLWEIALYENELRADDYIAAQTGDDGYRELERTPCITFAGHLYNSAEEVRLNIEAHRMWGFVSEGKESYYIEPLNRFAPSAPDDHYVVYASENVIPGEGSCGASHAAERSVDHLHSSHEAKAGDDCRKLEIATESDYEFYDDDLTFSDIIGNLNLVESVYMNYYDMKFIVVFQHQWTTSADPYTTDESGCGGFGTMQQFATYWFNNFSNIRRDINVYYSRKDFSGSTIGCAWIGVFGNNNNNSGYSTTQGIVGAYSVNQWDWAPWWTFTSDAERRALVAHEMGHNFGAEHDDTNCSGSGSIMCPSINTSTTFLSTAQNQMNADMDLNTAQLNDGRSALRIREIPANSNATTVTMFTAGTVSGNQLDLSAQFLYNTFLIPFSGTRTFQATEKVRMLPGFKIAGVGNNKVVVKTGACDINSALNSLAAENNPESAATVVNQVSGEAAVYPNPTAGMVTLDMRALDERMLLVRLYDMYGKLLLAFERPSAGDGQVAFDLSPFADGMYILQITDQNNQKIESLKIQKIS